MSRGGVNKPGQQQRNLDFKFGISLILDIISISTQRHTGQQQSLLDILLLLWLARSSAFPFECDKQNGGQGETLNSWPGKPRRIELKPAAGHGGPVICIGEQPRSIESDIYWWNAGHTRSTPTTQVQQQLSPTRILHIIDYIHAVISLYIYLLYTRE